MSVMETPIITPGDVRDILELLELDVTAPAWPHPGYIIVGGKRYEPTGLPGTLLVNGEQMFSTSWR